MGVRGKGRRDEGVRDEGVRDEGEGKWGKGVREGGGGKGETKMKMKTRYVSSGPKVVQTKQGTFGSVLEGQETHGRLECPWCGNKHTSKFGVALAGPNACACRSGV